MAKETKFEGVAAQLEREANAELERITKGFEATHEDALVGQARKAIDQALLQIFGGVQDRDNAKKMIFEQVKAVIKKFNDELSREIHKTLEEHKARLQAELKKEINDMRGHFMNELKNL